MAPFVLPSRDGVLGKGMRYAFDDFVLDTDSFELTCRGERRVLQKRPLDLLVHLVTHRHRVVTKEELVTAVWGARVTDNAIAQAVSCVRAALGPGGNDAVRTIHGRGYRFVLLVHEDGDREHSVIWRTESPALRQTSQSITPKEGP